MTPYALLFTLSAIGISETVYLIRTRIASRKPICPIGHGCEAVLSSKYNRLFIFPNDVLGLLAYIAMSLATALLVLTVPPAFFWALVLKILVGISSLISFLLTYLQWRVINVWCFWCLMSACIIWLMGVILLVTL